MQPLKLQPFWPPATCLRLQETLVTTKLPLLIAFVYTGGISGLRHDGHTDDLYTTT